MLSSQKKKSTHYKTIFISDIHLGTRGCQAEKLLDFLAHNTCDRLYLVGDIIDGWRLQRRIYWPQSHNDVIRKFLSVAKKGGKVYYVLGNHDEMLRQYLSDDLNFGRVLLSNQKDFVSISGKRYLVVHGDMFDSLMKKDLKWLMHVGDVAYNFLIWVNTKFNKIRGWLGLEYWSLSKYLKSRTKQALNFIEGFEDKLADYAHKRGYDGVICGHIHSATIKQLDNIQYINTGDWVESCTAIVETMDGKIKLIEWK